MMDNQSHKLWPTTISTTATSCWKQRGKEYLKYEPFCDLTVNSCQPRVLKVMSIWDSLQIQSRCLSSGLSVLRGSNGKRKCVSLPRCSHHQCSHRGNCTTQVVEGSCSLLNNEWKAVKQRRPITHSLISTYTRWKPCDDDWNKHIIVFSLDWKFTSKSLMRTVVSPSQHQTNCTPTISIKDLR